MSPTVVLPIETERFLAILDWYMREGARESPAARASMEFGHEIQLENFVIWEAVKKCLLRELPARPLPHQAGERRARPLRHVRGSHRG